MQTSFCELEYTTKKRSAPRDRFLSRIKVVTPWASRLSALELYYPKTGKRGRSPIDLERMLRIHIVPQCFGLSDEGMEDAILDSRAIRCFIGIDLNREAAPDATTLLKFRRFLETHHLTKTIFNTVNLHLSQKGLRMREGSIVDATLIATPSPIKNDSGERDPKMHQTKKGNQLYFGMKARIGVDAESGLVHYVGLAKRDENQGRPVNWYVALRPGKRPVLLETTQT